MNFTNPKARLVNLGYCSAPVKARVKRILEGYSTHSLVVDVIRMGLNKDCVDVVQDLTLALDALTEVRDDLVEIGTRGGQSQPTEGSKV